MLAGLVDWAASEKLMLTASYSYQKTGGGVDFNSGNTAGRRRFHGRPARQLQHRQHDAQSLPDQGYVQLQPESGTSAVAMRTRSTTTAMARWRATEATTGTSMNLNTAAVGSNYSWLTGAFANPGYTANVFWADRDVQVRTAAAVHRRRCRSRSAEGRPGRRRQRRRRRRRRRHRRSRRSRSIRRCCSTSTRRC